jgi:hypothetical protein
MYYIYLTLACSEKGVRLAQKMRVNPRIPVGLQLEKAGVGPTLSSGPTRHLSHLLCQLCEHGLRLAFTTARAGKRRFLMLSALRAHTKAPYKTDLPWKMIRPLKRPGGPGQLDLLNEPAR